MACWVYIEQISEFSRLMNTKDLTKMTTNQKYVEKISHVRYKSKPNGKTGPKDKNKAQVRLDKNYI